MDGKWLYGKELQVVCSCNQEYMGECSILIYFSKDVHQETRWVGCFSWPREVDRKRKERKNYSVVIL